MERPDLGAALAAAADPSERRRLIVAFAGFCRGLHQARVDADLSPANVLPDGAEFRLRHPGARRLWLRRRRWQRLAQLHRQAPGLVSAGDQLRFLRRYLGDGDRQERRTAWRAILPAYRRLQRDEARRAAREAFRTGTAIAREGASLYVRRRRGSAAVRLHLDAAQCRTIWRLAHVFERLGLPALRPVRLDAHSVDLLAPDLDEHAMDYHAAVARALRRFEPYGRFVRDPEWALTSAGAVLLTPNAFRLELQGPTGSCTSSRPGTRERRRRSS